MTIPCQPTTGDPSTANCENETLQSHFENSYHDGEAEPASHAAECRSPINDDVVRISLLIVETSIEEAWFKASGCVICQASASVLCESVEGMTLEDAANLSADGFLEIIGTPLPIDGQRCALLPWRVFQRALQTSVSDEDDADSIHFGGPSLSEES